ncbi:MAG TPA: hypothetical protein EYH34_08995 [Planctomycetes bacterium]|nr:hypothetical protein [Planctomycetota bacterium]
MGDAGYGKDVLLIERAAERPGPIDAHLRLGCPGWGFGPSSRRFGCVVPGHLPDRVPPVDDAVAEDISRQPIYRESCLARP